MKIEVGDLVEFTRRDLGIQGSSLALVVNVVPFNSFWEYDNPTVSLMFLDGSVVRHPLKVWKELKVIS